MSSTDGRVISSIGVKLLLGLGGLAAVLAIWHFTVEAKVQERLVEKRIAEVRAELADELQAKDDSLLRLEAARGDAEARVDSLEVELTQEEAISAVNAAASDSLGSELERRAGAGDSITAEDIRELNVAHAAETGSLNRRITLLEAEVLAEREAKELALRERDVERERSGAIAGANTSLEEQIAILNRKAHPNIFQQAKRAAPWMAATAIAVWVASQ